MQSLWRDMTICPHGSPETQLPLVHSVLLHNRNIVCVWGKGAALTSLVILYAALFRDTAKLYSIIQFIYFMLRPRNDKSP